MYHSPSIYSYLKELVPDINQCVDKFLDNLEPSARTKSPVSLREEVALLTLNVISKVSITIVIHVHSVNFPECVIKNHECMLPMSLSHLGG